MYVYMYVSRITLTDTSKAFCSMTRAARTDSTNLVPRERIATFSGTFAYTAHTVVVVAVVVVEG